MNKKKFVHKEAMQESRYMISFSYMQDYKINEPITQYVLTLRL